jgi:hypothetical protein
VKDVLVYFIEEKEIYVELQKLKVDVADIKNADLRHEQLGELLEILKKILSKKP